MTNEEAIQFLSQIMDALLASNSWLPSTDNPIKESFGMAINALKAQEQLGNVSPELDKENGELIRRKAAIDVLYKNYILGRGDLNEVLDHIVDRLEKLPSAQPERKKGRWIHDGRQFRGGIDWMHCSECGHKDNWNAVRTPFCAWCGASMEGEL